MLLIKEEINRAKIHAGFTAQQINLNYGEQSGMVMKPCVICICGLDNAQC